MSAPSLPSLLVSHWAPSASVLVPAVASAAVYGLAVRRAAGRWPIRRTASFLAGIACVVLALQSGIDAYDDRMLSVHMVQHMLLLLVAPPLLLGGRPVVLALRSLSPGPRRSFATAMDRARGCTGPAAGAGVVRRGGGAHAPAARSMTPPFATPVFTTLSTRCIWWRGC